MMDVPLNTWLLFAHAGRHFADVEIVTRHADGLVHRYTYADYVRRTQQLMHAVDRLGLDADARVATLAWNGYRHLEAYFAVPCTGRVLHTLNVRLSVDDLAYIIADAGDRVILADPDQIPLLERLQAEGALREVAHVVVLADTLPDTTLREALSYEDLLADAPDHYSPRDIPETTPLGLCYTSGTTGRPRGALYTHRSTFLHALGVTSAAGAAVGPGDCVLSMVPMFHASAWGLPYAGVAVGAKQVFLNGPLDARALIDLLLDEDVTIAAGVPTVWFAAADELAARGARLERMRHIMCGGSQPPRALIERYLREFGVPIVQAWGMTETSPLASMAWPKASMRDWPEEKVTAVARSQAGLPLPGVEVSIRDDAGAELPWDGKAMGNLYVRGPWVVDSYVGGEGRDQFEDGWFRTGDVAIGSPHGYFVIADRVKDLIKSGGEWISSVDMEAALMAMPGVAEAAVIAVPDEKWGERPLACVVPAPGAAVALEAVREHLLASGFARWQLPDRISILETVPRTGVGKFDKKALRARLEPGA